jgi:hypothetical protein
VRRLSLAGLRLRRLTAHRDRRRPLLARPTLLSLDEFAGLVRFGLLDRAVLDRCDVVPASVPSGLPVARFQVCSPAGRAAPLEPLANP